MTERSDFTYSCEIDVSFPSEISAKRTRDVLIVDREIGDRVVKTLEILPDDPTTIRISFRASEAKMLRVTVSGFCDYLIVALKCQQEFDTIVYASGVEHDPLVTTKW